VGLWIFFRQRQCKDYFEILSNRRFSATSGVKEHGLKALEGPAWIIIGIAICLYAYKMGLGSFREPGAGFVAFVTGLFLMLMGALIVMGRKRGLQRIPKDEKREVPAYRQAGNDSEGSFLGSPAFKLAYAVALLLVYALFLDHLGYVLTTFLVMFGLFYDPGRHRFGLALTAAFLSAGMTYVVFEMWLHSQLPRGIFPWR
jgi:hypothetical protein